MSSADSGWLRDLAVRGVLWRRLLDWTITNVPFYLHPILLWFCTVFFFFFAAPARRSLVANLAVVLPGSNWFMNQLRAFRTLHTFAWTIAEAAVYKLRQAEFAYSIEGEAILDELAAARGAIVLTAHMGNYDLGAALFAQKVGRELRMVREPEADVKSAEHLQASLQQIGAGAVRIDYNTQGAALSFDLLQALRNGEIVSIQGDRATRNAAEAIGRIFNTDVPLPSGPFTLAFAAQVPIYPLFVVRLGYRRYRIILRAPLHLLRSGPDRAVEISQAIGKWCRVLEEILSQHHRQWFAFTPLLMRHAES
ncbi:MAG: lysophospholipid acyltransferase family protein [Chthoniobacterales bacterium]